MKNSLIFLSLLLAASKVFAQGTLVFANLSTGVNAPAIAVDLFHQPTGRGLSGLSLVADLYFNTSTNVSTDSLQPAGFNVPFSTTTLGGGGYFLGGSRTVPGATGFIVAQVRVWDSRFGTSYESVSAAGVGPFGFSNPVIVKLVIPPDPPLPMTGLTYVHVFNVIPEPSELALAGLGVAAFLIHLNRKSLNSRGLEIRKKPRT